ncbi:MAG: hypothetical protein RI996_172 [Candidatus Parcubacteria bacterium]|jgi:hypothetical protein
MKPHTFSKIISIAITSALLLSPFPVIAQNVEPIQIVSPLLILPDNPTITPLQATTSTVPQEQNTNTSIGSIGTSAASACVSNLVADGVGGLAAGAINKVKSKGKKVIVDAVAPGETSISVDVDGGAAVEETNTITASLDAKALVEKMRVQCLDPAAREIYRQMLIKTDQSILNWANNGFKGGPLDGTTFPTDLDSYFGSFAESATETWLADLNKNNTYYDQITRAVSLSVRDTNNGYTPDLAEAIFAAQCAEYKRRQTPKVLDSIQQYQSRETGLNGWISNLFNGANNDVRPSQKPFNSNQIPTKPTNAFGGISAFDIFSVQKTYAQSGRYMCVVKNKTGGPVDQSNLYNTIDSCGTFAANTLSRVGLVGAGGSYTLTDTSTGKTQTRTIDPGSSGLQINSQKSLNDIENPCDRPNTTAADKKLIIAQFSRYPVSDADNRDLMQRAFQANNVPSIAAQNAVNSQKNAVARVQETERQTLANNDGNTGARVCVSFIPQSAEDRAANRIRTCRSDGFRTITPGSIVANRVFASLNLPNADLQAQASVGTFKDLLNSATRSIITGMTNQLINNVDNGVNGARSSGFGSFNSNSKSNQGAFTSGVRNINTTPSASQINSVNTSIATTDAYLQSITNNKKTLDSIISTVTEVKTVCSQILALRSNSTSNTGGRGITQDQLDSVANIQSDRCNIDPNNQDFTANPSALNALNNNPIYLESINLPNTIANRDQLVLSIAEVSKTKKILEDSKTDYTAGGGTNREAVLLTTLGELALKIPEVSALQNIDSTKAELEERLATITQVLTELKTSLAELKR